MKKVSSKTNIKKDIKANPKNKKNYIIKDDKIKNINQKNNNKQEKEDDIRNEKIIIVFLIMLAFALLFCSLFFIHNIVDKNKIKDTISTVIPNPDNNVLGEQEDNSNKGQGSQTGNKNEGTSNEEEEIIIDNSARFKVLQGKDQWSELKQLDIFRNKYFNDESIIAPGVDGSYNFTVENESDSKFEYDVVFIEENKYNVTMVYKLKVNGNYLAGNSNEWVKYDKLNRSKMIINANSIDLYTIEWKWQDAPNDTEVGQTEGANYKMNIQVNATQIVE